MKQQVLNSQPFRVGNMIAFGFVVCVITCVLFIIVDTLLG